MSNFLKVTALVFTFFFFSSFSSLNSVSAATLNSVGSVNVEGSSFSHLWYTGTNPTFAGTTTPGTSVSITIDNQTAAAIVSTSGNWTYPTSLTAGDHSVSISSQGVVFSSFTLTIGESAPENSLTDSTVSASEALPSTGAFEFTLITATLGVFLVIGSRFLPKKSS